MATIIKINHVKKIPPPLKTVAISNGTNKKAKQNAEAVNITIILTTVPMNVYPTILQSKVVLNTGS